MNTDNFEPIIPTIPAPVSKISWLQRMRSALVTLWAVALFLLVPAFFLSYQGNWMGKVAAAWNLKERSSTQAPPPAASQGQETATEKTPPQPTPTIPAKNVKP